MCWSRTKISITTIYRYIYTLYIYVCMYVCMCVCVYVYTHAHVNVTLEVFFWHLCCKNVLMQFTGLMRFSDILIQILNTFQPSIQINFVLSSFYLSPRSVMILFTRILAVLKKYNVTQDNIKMCLVS